MYWIKSASRFYSFFFLTVFTLLSFHLISFSGAGEKSRSVKEYTEKHTQKHELHGRKGKVKATQPTSIGQAAAAEAGDGEAPRTRNRKHSWISLEFPISTRKVRRLGRKRKRGRNASWSSVGGTRKKWRERWGERWKVNQSQSLIVQKIQIVQGKS